MLLELNIRNIALIDQLRINFAPGLNVLTGETGAGKSIVVDSVNLVLGARLNKELIRSGEDSASVSALFELRGNKALLSLLDEFGIHIEDDIMIIGREVSLSGRSVCRVDGDVVPLAKYRLITSLLVDVHGQHEHQALLSTALHLAYVDAYGGEEHARLMDSVHTLYEQYTQTTKEIERLTLDSMERERRTDILRGQIAEIEAVKPKIGEIEKLQQKNNLFKNAEKIASRIEQAYLLVYKGEGRALSAQDAIKRAADAMEQIGPIDERFARIAQRLEDLFYQVQDIGYELGDMQGEIEYDPRQSERIDDRLNELKKLQRKYGPETEDVLKFLDSAKRELAELDMGDDRLRALAARRDGQKLALIQESNQLTERRKALARAFEQKLLMQLRDLGMGRTRFEVRFDESKDVELRLSANGVDRVEFMISPNPGEPLKPLSQIASGGEMARIMLAMKAISADNAGVDTMIFDEIDTGVSGRMAQVVGEKMAEVARNRQVICVTHLPQIAALGQAHFVVEKTVQGERTGSGVRRLDDQGRVEELARLLSGADDIKGGWQYAQSMLEAAQRLVTELNSNR